ncbi:hypothetical protein F4782DRAFT_532498 [Xylaria castorea]|nr:hypothetical protein F4782DRAFT_532498 [Xylaria castorea]
MATKKSSLAGVLEKLKQQYHAIKGTPDTQATIQYEKALLGVEISTLEQQIAIMDEELLVKEKPTMNKKAYENRQTGITDRKISAGDSLWDHTKKKARLDNPGAVSLLKPGSEAAVVVGESLLAMYRALDGVKNTSKKRTKTWRADVEKYYEATGQDNMTWCHACGKYRLSENIKAAHIVPFFLHLENLSTEIFGRRGYELQTPSNSLLLSGRIKCWFDKYCLVIVPVDYDETPITRWKIEIVGNSIANTPYEDIDSSGHQSVGKDLDGKELQFLSKERPASRFLYFHFIMALVRIRDIHATGWKEVWARYFTKQPFPAPGNYLRQTMLLAISQHFQTTDVKLIESWIKGEGFEKPITLSDEEAARVANRVQAAVEEAKEGFNYEDSEDENSEDEESEDEDSENYNDEPDVRPL